MPVAAEGEERNPPLNGIGVEEAGANAPRIEIMFGGESPGDEGDEAPEIEDAGRVKTMLSFESFLKRKRMLQALFH